MASATQKAGYSTKSAPSTKQKNTTTSPVKNPAPSLPKASGSGSSALSSALSKATSSAPATSTTKTSHPIAVAPTASRPAVGGTANLTGKTTSQSYTPTKTAPLSSTGFGNFKTASTVSAPVSSNPTSKPSGNSAPKYTPGAPVQGAQAPSQTPQNTQPEWLATAPDMATVNQGSSWGTSDPSYGGGDIGGSIRGVMDTYAQSSAQDQANMAVMMEGMLQYIDQMGANITSQIRSQMGMDDPETANAIAMIKKQAEDTYKVMLEDLNAKGLVQSGIYAQARADLANNQGMQVSNFVAQRFGDLQSQLNNALMSIGQMRVGAMSQNMSMTNANNMQNNATLANLGMQGINAQLTQRGQDMAQNQWQQSFDWGKQTDTRDFAYKQGRDVINDQYTQQGLDIQRTSANNSGAGNALGWEQLNWQKDQTAQQNKAYAYDYGIQNVAQLGAGIKDMNSYNYAVQQIANNPMYADTGVKQALLTQLEQYKPQIPATTTNNGYTPFGTMNNTFKNGGNVRLNPWK